MLTSPCDFQLASRFMKLFHASFHERSAEICNLHVSLMCRKGSTKSLVDIPDGQLVQAEQV